ncbi:MAG: hypothetical protein HYY01_15805 [Chloroflexi bacterium]|nr:hypothetical protein [Chloroflexota bacterium]
MTSSPRIEAFLIDNENEEKFAVHGLSASQVLQVLDNVHVVLRNRKRRRGVYLIIGRDDGGACIAAPVEPTHEAMLWRPITAWPCKPHEKTTLEKARRNHEEGA